MHADRTTHSPALRPPVSPAGHAPHGPRAEARTSRPRLPPSSAWAIGRPAMTDPAITGVVGDRWVRVRGDRRRVTVFQRHSSSALGPTWKRTCAPGAQSAVHRRAHRSTAWSTRCGGRRGERPQRLFRPDFDRHADAFAHRRPRRVQSLQASPRTLHHACRQVIARRRAPGRRPRRAPDLPPALIRDERRPGPRPRGLRQPHRRLPRPRGRTRPQPPRLIPHGPGPAAAEAGRLGADRSGRLARE